MNQNKKTTNKRGEDTKHRQVLILPRGVARGSTKERNEMVGVSYVIYFWMVNWNKGEGDLEEGRRNQIGKRKG